MTHITDDNDNLVKVPDEKWEETPSGNYKIEIDLDQDVLANLVDMWARDNLHEASLEQYNEVMEETGNQRDALHGAVVNDIIIMALTQQIEHMTCDADTQDV